jgi:hypothetical protein
MKIALTLASILACFGLALPAQMLAPERRVIGSTIISDHDPKVRIELPREVQYLGADRWILYDIADCELHAFVEVNAQKQVVQLYWVQFESYVPTRPALHHTYDSPRHAKIGGLDFYVDTWPRARNEEPTAGSDLEHINALITAKGFTLPEGMMYLRLVHLLDDQKRKELMIIYAESLHGTGYTAADLSQDAKSPERRLQLERALIERGEAKIRVYP